MIERKKTCQTDILNMKKDRKIKHVSVKYKRDRQYNKIGRYFNMKKDRKKDVKKKRERKDKEKVERQKDKMTKKEDNLTKQE